MKIGDPILVPFDDVTLPDSFLTQTELSGIKLYATDTLSVAGLDESLEGKSQKYAVLVEYPDEEFLHVYMYPTEEDVLEEIWDIEYRIADFIYT